MLLMKLYILVIVIASILVVITTIFYIKSKKNIQTDKENESVE